MTYKQFAQTISVSEENSDKRVSAVTVRIRSSDNENDLYITDIMLQSGKVATGWAGHVSEIPWTQDG